MAPPVTRNPTFLAEVATINRFSNSAATDMVGYSMGGTGVGKLLMVGTLNQGSRVASLALVSGGLSKSHEPF